MSSPTSRAGVSLPEALVVLVLAAVLVHLAWTTLREQSRVARRAAALTERLEAARATRFVLDGEVRAGVAGRDWIGPAGDSIAVRAFRGVGLPCVGPTGSWDGTVRYRGVRRPDPEKDSVLVLAPDGTWRTLGLEGARADPGRPCRVGVDGEGWSTERWSVVGPGGGPAGSFVVARIFERGSYHLADGALRYRRGRAGRQPLTPTLLDDRLSSFSAHAQAGLVVRLGFRDPAVEGDGPWWETTIRAADR